MPASFTTQADAVKLAGGAARGILTSLRALLAGLLAGTIKSATNGYLALNIAEARRDSALKDALADAAGSSLLGLADVAGSPIVGTTTNGGATATATENCAFQIPLPSDYMAGHDVTLVIRALVSAARNVSATVDAVVKLVGDAAVGSDICATAAQNLTTSYADYSFTITGTTLSPGSILNSVLTLATNDTGGSTNGTPRIAAVTLRYPRKISG